MSTNKEYSQLSLSHGVALIGNPGSGKSTILNGLTGKGRFKSGVSLGTGLTCMLEPCIKEHTVFFDTPGLADIEKRKSAAKELDKLLNVQLPIKIVFVVTLPHGRVSPDDAMTIDLVLGAINGIDLSNKFGVVINQVTDQVSSILEQNRFQYERVKLQLLGKHVTHHWHILKFDNGLRDATDGMLLTNELKIFISNLPVTKPERACVSPINTTNIEHMIDEYGIKIRLLEDINEMGLRMLLQEKEKRGNGVPHFNREQENDPMGYIKKFISLIESIITFIYKDRTDDDGRSTTRGTINS